MNKNRAIAASLLLTSGASGAQFVASSGETPVARVVALLGELKEKVSSDGKMEQASYDKYACWCEDTLARKASDISTAKETVTETQALIKKLKAEIATHGADIANADKLIKQNVASQKEATEVREGEKSAYVAEKEESENCLGALDAAIKVLNGAGTGKFLETSMQEAELLSVVAGVRGILRRPAVSRTVSDNDMDVVKHFVSRPEDFVAGSTGLAVVQMNQNPFGDYAPQSSQIQGILKGMHDAFTADIEKADAEEAEQAKSFSELMATKKQELTTLEATLERHNLDKAEKSTALAENKQVLDDTSAQLDADEAFFESTKKGCKTKASEWAERTRLRTEELQGMAKAIEILSSPDAQATFESSGTTFLQISSVSRTGEDEARDQAWKSVRTIARKYHSMNLARIAADLRTGGHFDKVIVAIDQMIVLLREEEQEDIEHRDRCQGSQNKNKNSKEDLAHSIDKTDRKLNRLGDTETDLKGKLSTLDEEIEALKTEMKELLDLRNKEVKDFKQAFQDDTDAVALISKAIVVLSDFYKRNKKDFALVQHTEPEYTVDPDKPPETSFSGGDYGGRKSESTGIVSILTMIKEDTELEMKTSRSDDAEAQQDYLKQNGAMTKSREALEATKSSTESELAEMQGKIEDTDEFLKQANTDMDGEKKIEESLNQDCAWVDSHFDTRREKRKTEIDGLVDAKNYLAGVESGNEV